MRPDGQGLETVAQIISSGKMDAYSFPWAALRYQHTQALYARLLGQYSPATANKVMAEDDIVIAETLQGGTQAKDIRDVGK